MNIIAISKEKFAEIVFANLSKNPKFDIYSGMERDEPVWGFRLEVIDFADSKTVIGNYYGGGSPFIYDFGSPDADGKYPIDAFVDFEVGFFEWLQESDFEDNVYVETYFGNVDELPLPRGFAERNRIAIVIEDGLVQDVYATDSELIVELIDKDIDDPDRVEEIRAEVEDLKVQIERGTLCSVW